MPDLSHKKIRRKHRFSFFEINERAIQHFQRIAADPSHLSYALYRNEELASMLFLSLKKLAKLEAEQLNARLMGLYSDAIPQFYCNFCVRCGSLRRKSRDGLIDLTKLRCKALRPARGFTVGEMGLTA